MPVSKQAAKKMRRDRRREKQVRQAKNSLQRIVKTSRQKPTPKNLRIAYQALDKAAKRRIIHRNKANRLKSRLSKLLK